MSVAPAAKSICDHVVREVHQAHEATPHLAGLTLTYVIMEAEFSQLALRELEEAIYEYLNDRRSFMNDVMVQSIFPCGLSDGQHRILVTITHSGNYMSYEHAPH